MGRLRISSGTGLIDRQRSCSAPVTPLSRLNPRMEALRGLSNVPQAAADSLDGWDLPPGDAVRDAVREHVGTQSGDQADAEGVAASEAGGAAEAQPAVEGVGAEALGMGEAGVSAVPSESRLQHDVSGEKQS